MHDLNIRPQGRPPVLESPAAVPLIIPGDPVNTNPDTPVCKSEQGCHRVAPCDPGCGTPWLCAEEAGPEDVLVDAVALLREAATLYDAREQPKSAGQLRALAHSLEAGSGPVAPDLAATTEAHRLALSTVLGLGTGAPWDAIHDRATELGLPPLDQDPVARRLGLLAAYRAKLLTEAADEAERVAESLRAHHEFERSTGALDVMTELRRLAAEAPTTTKPETLSPWRILGIADCQTPSAHNQGCACTAAGVGQDGAQPKTPCSIPECDVDGTGEPCTRHEIEQSHADGDHSLCRRAECEVLRQS